MSRLDEMEQLFNEVVRELGYVQIEDIPKMELYMDQVTSFMEDNLAASSRNPGQDKILTKTMINNYVKNDVLPAPIRKKYGTNQIVLLVMIFYLKSFLSLSDIEKLLRPVRERFAEQSDNVSIRASYTAICESVSDEIEAIQADTARQFEATRERFRDLPEEEYRQMMEFDLEARICAEIFIKKLYLERLLDSEDGFPQHEGDLR